MDSRTGGDRGLYSEKSSVKERRVEIRAEIQRLSDSEGRIRSLRQEKESELRRILYSEYMESNVLIV